MNSRLWRVEPGVKAVLRLNSTGRKHSCFGATCEALKSFSCRFPIASFFLPLRVLYVTS